MTAQIDLKASGICPGLMQQACVLQHYPLHLFPWKITKGNIFIFLKKKFGGHKSLSWGHSYPCFGLLVMSALGFKARMDPSLGASSPVHNRFLRFTSRVTPADCIEVSMAAKPFWSMYLQMCQSALVEVWVRSRTHDCLCHTQQARRCRLKEKILRNWQGPSYISEDIAICLQQHT